MKLEPVSVTWVDITTKAGWIEQEELDDFVMDNKENIVYQCGFLYEEDETQVVLLNSYFEGRTLLGDATKIPKGCILELKKLQ